MKKLKKLIIFLLIAAAIAGLLSSHVLDYAKQQQKVLAIGSDLTDEQRELILSYLNTDLKGIKEIKVTNKDIHKYLDNIVEQSEIPDNAYSTVFIEPRISGGIHIRTVNITTVTSDMIRNALVTSGVTNANIICVAPVEVSGTDCLAAIFKVYEKNTSNKLEDDKKNIATKELAQTINMSKIIGNNEAVELVSKLKEEIISSNLSESEITQKVKDYVDTNNIALTDEQKDNLIQLMLDISNNDYSVDDVKNAYQTTKTIATTVNDTTKTAKNWFNKVTDFFSVMWQKLWGTYQEVKEENDKISLGILDETNNSVFDESVIITETDYYNEESSQAESINNQKELNENEDMSQNSEIIDSTIDEENKNTEMTDYTDSTESENSTDEVISLRLEDCVNDLDYILYYLEHRDEIDNTNDSTGDTDNNTFESLTK